LPCGCTGWPEALKAQEQDGNARELSFLERLGLLIDQQWSWRENQALARRLKNAKLRGNPCVEDIDYRAARGLDRHHAGLNPGIGVGKESREHFRSRTNWRWQEFHCVGSSAESLPRRVFSFLHTGCRPVREFALARSDGSFRIMLARISRIDVLVVDDWAMAPLTETERRDFWEICEERYQTRSVILTSQMPVAKWHEQIGDPTVADGILDRLVHNAHRIEMRGDSMRKCRGKQT
jgi:hypothetical protein